MNYGNNKPMFVVDDAKLKQGIMDITQNGCIICVHDATCKRPLHGRFTFGGPVCPDAEHVSPIEIFRIVWGPALMPANKQSSWRGRKGK